VFSSPWLCAVFPAIVWSLVEVPVLYEYSTVDSHVLTPDLDDSKRYEDGCYK